MGLSDVQQQQLIIAMVGDENNVLAMNITQLWAQWAGKALVHPELQVLYVKRDCIRIIMSLYRKKADFSQTAGVSIKTSQWFTALTTMLAEVSGEIVKVEKKARGSRVGVVSTLTTVTGSVPPDSPDAPPPSDYIDANDPMYRGDPYYDSNAAYGGTLPALVAVEEVL